MNHIVLSQIERNILQLPVDEQLLLISRLAERLRRKVENVRDFESQLEKMASDAQIRQEMTATQNDFNETEFDGLAR